METVRGDREPGGGAALVRASHWQRDPEGARPCPDWAGQEAELDGSWAGSRRARRGGAAVRGDGAVWGTGSGVQGRECRGCSGRECGGMRM